MKNVGVLGKAVPASPTAVREIAVASKLEPVSELSLALRASAGSLTSEVNQVFADVRYFAPAAIVDSELGNRPARDGIAGAVGDALESVDEARKLVSELRAYLLG